MAWLAGELVIQLDGFLQVVEQDVCMIARVRSVGALLVCVMVSARGVWGRYKCACVGARIPCNRNHCKQLLHLDAAIDDTSHIRRRWTSKTGVA